LKGTEIVVCGGDSGGGVSAAMLGREIKRGSFVGV